MKPHKILITGTFESGKTELVRLYTGDPRVATVSEIARDVLALDSSLQLKPGFQDILFSEQLKKEVLAEATGKPIILCDRGVLDIIAFSLALDIPIKKEWLSNSLGRYGDIMICNAGDIPYSASYEGLDSQSFRNQIDLKIRQVANELVSVDMIRPIINEIKGTLKARKFFLDKHIELTMLSKEGNRLSCERGL